MVFIEGQQQSMEAQFIIGDIKSFKKESKLWLIQKQLG